MSEQEMNAYRFNSGKEPSDEMLAQIMKEAALDAKKRQEQATSIYFAKMRENIESKKAKWANRINGTKHGHA